MNDLSREPVNSPIISYLSFKGAHYREMLSRYRAETYQGNQPTPNSSGNTQPQLSQLTEPLCDPGLKVKSVGASWSPLQKKKKKAQVGE